MKKQSMKQSLRRICSILLMLIMIFGLVTVPVGAQEQEGNDGTIDDVVYAEATEAGQALLARSGGPVIENVRAYSATDVAGGLALTANPGEMVVIYGEVSDANHPDGVITPHYWSGVYQGDFGLFPRGTLGYDFIWRQGDAGTYDGDVSIRVRTGQSYAGAGATRRRAAAASASFTVPADAQPGETIEIIFEVIDDGDPRTGDTEHVMVTVGYATPSVYPQVMYISTYGAGPHAEQLAISLGDGPNRANHVTIDIGDNGSDFGIFRPSVRVDSDFRIVGHMPGIVGVSTPSLTDDGVITVSAVGNGTAYIVLRFYDEFSNFLEDIHYRVMAVESEHYANMEYSRLSVQEAVDLAHMRRVELDRLHYYPRYIATTDIETDDMNSMVRLLLYTNEIDLVGIVYSSATHHWRGDGERLFTGGAALHPMVQYRWMGSQGYQAMVETYRLVQENLQSFDSRFPDADYLRDMIFEGNIAVVGDMLGPTEGSDLIVRTLLDKRDTSPVVLTSWGGSNTIAQALQTIEEMYSGTPEWAEIQQWVSDRAIIYNIGTQDPSTNEYIIPYWPDVTLIVNTNFTSVAFNPSLHANTPASREFYLRDEFHLRHIMYRPITQHYQVFNDGLNLMNISWDANDAPTPEELADGPRQLRLARGAADAGIYGHVEPTMGWYPRFLRNVLIHNNFGRQGLNSGTPDNYDLRGGGTAAQVGLMGEWVPAPWRIGARMHRLICPIADYRWYEFGEPQHEDFGNPRLISSWNFGNAARNPNNFPGIYYFYSEGDSPSFFHVMETGLRSIECPSFGGWGNRFVRSTAPVRGNDHWISATGAVADHVPDWAHTSAPTVGQRGWWAQQRWLPEIQYDWSARITWTLDVSELRPGERHNRHPVVGIDGDLDRYVKAGDTVTLIGTATDPDGDELEISWWRYWEADTYEGRPVANRDSAFADESIAITVSSDGLQASLVVPEDAQPGDTIHIIFEVTDVAPDGVNYFTPLTRYQRVILTVESIIEFTDDSAGGEMTVSPGEFATMTARFNDSEIVGNRGVRWRHDYTRGYDGLIPMDWFRPHNRESGEISTSRIMVPFDAVEGDRIYIIFEVMPTAAWTNRGGHDAWMALPEADRIVAYDTLVIIVGPNNIPTTSESALYITTGQSDTFTVDLGAGTNRAASVTIVSSDPSVVTASPTTLTDDGTITLTTVGSGTARLLLTFTYEDGRGTRDGDPTEIHMRAMSIDSDRYAHIGPSLLTPQEAVALANESRRPGLPRYLATTDNEIDDMATFNRLLMYSNEMDIVGLVYSSAEWRWAGTDGREVHLSGGANQQRFGTSFRWLGAQGMQMQIEAYRLVVDNLNTNRQPGSPEFADPDYLRDMVFIGNIEIEGCIRFATPGSDLIKYTLLCEEDDSELWLSAWGGTNTIARALRCIREEFNPAFGGSLTAEAWDALYNRIIEQTRLYIILDQDDSYDVEIVAYWPDLETINNRSQFWTFAYQWMARTPSAIRPYLSGEMVRPHIIDINSPLLYHYLLIRDGHNITRRLWDPAPNMEAIGVHTPGVNPDGDLHAPMGWAPEFVSSPTAVIGSADYLAGLIGRVEAPWPLGQGPTNWLTDFNDPRWWEWGETGNEHRGHPNRQATGANAHPPFSFISEGDSPTFFHILDVGLRSSENPSWGGWSGRMEQNTCPVSGDVPLPALWSDIHRSFTPHVTSPGGTFSNPPGNAAAQVLAGHIVSDYVPAHLHNGEVVTAHWQGSAISRWFPAIQNDWFARSLWTIAAEDLPDGRRHNHAPIVGVTGDLDRYVLPGETVNLVGTATDPDGDTLNITWWHYVEAGSYRRADVVAATHPNDFVPQSTIVIATANTLSASLVVPVDAQLGDTIHIILEVTDVAPADVTLFTPLTRYQRVVLTIGEEGAQTVVLTPDTVTVNDANLIVTSTVSGTAESEITLDTSALPTGVTATVNQESGVITVTGVRPAHGQEAITGTFEVEVTRGGVSEILEVVVNLTPLLQVPPQQTFVVRFMRNTSPTDNNVIHQEQVQSGNTVSRPADPTRVGYEFVGWTTDRAGNNTFNFNTIITANIDVFAQWEEEYEDVQTHTWFMMGRVGGNFVPSGNITRAEVATMLVRTMIPEYDPALPPPSGMPFPDVRANDWFFGYVSWAYDAGFIEGRPDGSFDPRARISRQEVAAMVARATGVDILPVGEFSSVDADLISTWAQDYVYTVYRQGWMIGNTRNQLQPRRSITRAETAAVFFRVLERGVTNADSLVNVADDLRIFPDVAYSRWYYYYVIEASHTHEFIMEDDVEIWVSVELPPGTP